MNVEPLARRMSGLGLGRVKTLWEEHRRVAICTRPAKEKRGTTVTPGV
jgi:hypothetical protein